MARIQEVAQTLRALKAFRVDRVCNRVFCGLALFGGLGVGGRDGGGTTDCCKGWAVILRPQLSVHTWQLGLAKWSQATKYSQSVFYAPAMGQKGPKPYTLNIEGR